MQLAAVDHSFNYTARLNAFKRPWVASSGSVARYASPYGGAASPNLSIGHPAGIDVDGAENLYVVDSTANTLTQYVASSAYSVGLNAGSLPQVSSVSAGALLSVCAVGNEFTYLYGGGALQLVETTFTNSTVPCLVASDYTNHSFTAAIQSTYTDISANENNLDVRLQFVVGATAVYPAAGLDTSSKIAPSYALLRGVYDSQVKHLY